MLDFIHHSVATLPNNVYGGIRPIMKAYVEYCQDYSVEQLPNEKVLAAIVREYDAKVSNGLLEGAALFDAETLLKPGTDRSPLTAFIRDYCRVRKGAKTPTKEAYDLYVNIGGTLSRPAFTREMCRALTGRIDKKLTSIKGEKHNAFINLEMI